MKAFTYSDYGPPDVVRIEDVEKPTPTDDEVLVKVRAVSVNPIDWHLIRGTPYVARLVMGLRRPKDTRVGIDYAGRVEAVGSSVTQFRPGDEVFGGVEGAFAEYLKVCMNRGIARKPTNLTLEDAAAINVAGRTALQAIRDRARIQPGQKVLINGASGGVGTFAVQIAKSFGADVTGVCSTRNVGMVRSLGGDHVVDYTKEDFTKTTERYDVLIDNVGNCPLSECRRILKPQGKFILIGGGGPNAGNVIGPFAAIIKTYVLSKFVSQQMGFFLTQPGQQDLNVLRDLIESGKVKPVIDRRYEFSELPEAIRYLEAGHAGGKVVITVS